MTPDKQSPDSATIWPRVILRGDYPDPTILRDGEDYYMTHSPEVYLPGFLLWHSKDLLHWTPVCRPLIKHVGMAIAPDLVKFGDRYYIYFPAANVNWVIWADDIRGPWSDPIQLEAGEIDPGHAVGEDGKRYLFLSAGHMVPLSDDGLSITGKLKKVYEGWVYPCDWETEGMYLESPKIIRKDGFYYMISAEGGTAGPPTSHMVVAARSKSIHGPWENSPYNPIVHTYSADEPWWSKGHGTLIDDVNGNWWMVYHAYEAGYHTLGRMTLIDPIEWTDDGWFRLAQKAPNSPGEKPTTWGLELSDDFSGKDLSLQWTDWGSHDPQDITVGREGLHLQAKGSDPKNARLLLITVPDTSYETSVEVTLEAASRGGLILFYSEKAFAGISSDGQQFTTYEDADQTRLQSNPFGNHFFLKIINQQNRCDLLASGDGRDWSTIRSNLDVSHMHHNQYGGFFALRIGLLASGTARVRFNDFVYTKLEASVG